MSMNPEFAEAMLRVLNDNAEAMARHIATGQTVIMKPIPNPLDYPQGEADVIPTGLTRPPGHPQAGRPDRPRPPAAGEIKITFLAPDDYLSDSTKRMIEDELNEHLAQTFVKRGLHVSTTRRVAGRVRMSVWKFSLHVQGEQVLTIPAQAFGVPAQIVKVACAEGQPHSLGARRPGGRQAGAALRHHPHRGAIPDGLDYVGSYLIVDGRVRRPRLRACGLTEPFVLPPARAGRRASEPRL